MNKLKKRNGRVYCDMCNQSFPDEAACDPFLKDGETVVECIERNRKDTGMVLRLLAQEKLRTEQLRELVGELVNALIGVVGCSDPDELRAMELAVRSMPAPDADKAATINAIHALCAALAGKQQQEGE